MTYTNEQIAWAKNEFRKRDRRQVLLIILLVPIVLVARGLIPVPIEIPGGVFLAAIAIVILASYRNWRCPNCGALQGATLSIKSCPHCQIPLRD